MNDKLRTLCFGEILWDIISNSKSIGGAPFNVAAHLARLSCESYIVSAVGTDELGRDALQRLQSLEVHSDYVRTDASRPTGTAVVKLDDEGVPTFFITPDTAYETLTAELNGTFDVLCYGTLALHRSTGNQALLQKLLKLDTIHKKFYDVNLRMDLYTPTLIDQLISAADILKLNNDEAHLIAKMLLGYDTNIEHIASSLFEKYSLDTVLITCGADGCYVYSHGTGRMIATIPVTVADTVGSGDAFSAAFLRRYLLSHDAFDAAHEGNLLGSFVASQVGAIPQYNESVFIRK